MSQFASAVEKARSEVARLVAMKTIRPADAAAAFLKALFDLNNPPQLALDLTASWLKELDAAAGNFGSEDAAAASARTYAEKRNAGVNVTRARPVGGGAEVRSARAYAQKRNRDDAKRAHRNGK